MPMQKNKMIVIQILECRWCNKKVVPDLNTGKYPFKCSNRSCRRQTWNKTDKEIKQNKLKSITALLDNHHKGKVNRKEKYIAKLLAAKQKHAVCTICDLIFFDEMTLQKHQARRHVD